MLPRGTWFRRCTGGEPGQDAQPHSTRRILARTASGTPTPGPTTFPWHHGPSGVPPGRDVAVAMPGERAESIGGRDEPSVPRQAAAAFSGHAARIRPGSVGSRRSSSSRKNSRATTSPVISKNASPNPDHQIGQEPNQPRSQKPIQPGSRATKRFDEESNPRSIGALYHTSDLTAADNLRGSTDRPIGFGEDHEGGAGDGARADPIRRSKSSRKAPTDDSPNDSPDSMRCRPSRSHCQAGHAASRPAARRAVGGRAGRAEDHRPVMRVGFAVRDLALGTWILRKSRSPVRGRLEGRVQAVTFNVWQGIWFRPDFG